MSDHQFHTLLSVSAPIAVLLTYYGYWQMVRRLKRAFPSVRKELGEPGIFKAYAKPTGKRQRLSSFLVLRRYRMLNDPALTFYGDFTLVFLSICVCLAIASFIFLGMIESQL